MLKRVFEARANLFNALNTALRNGDYSQNDGRLFEVLQEREIVVAMGVLDRDLVN